MDIPVEMSNRHLNYINSEFRVMSLTYSFTHYTKTYQETIICEVIVTAMGMLI